MRIPVLKASTGKWFRCFFPYTADGAPLSENDIKTRHKAAYDYLLSNKSDLMKRSIEKSGDLYLFGRSQALKDVQKDKVAVNQLIRDKSSLKINPVPRGSGVYGGLVRRFKRRRRKSGFCFEHGRICELCQITEKLQKRRILHLFVERFGKISDVQSRISDFTVFFDTLRRCFPSAWRWSWDRRLWERA